MVLFWGIMTRKNSLYMFRTDATITGLTTEYMSDSAPLWSLEWSVLLNVKRKGWFISDFGLCLANYIPTIHVEEGCVFRASFRDWIQVEELGASELQSIDQ